MQDRTQDEMYNVSEHAENISSMETPFSEINAFSVTQSPTPGEWIKEREIGNKKLSYVSGDLVIRILNKAFRNRWSFEVKDSIVFQAQDKVYRDYKTKKETRTPQGSVVEVLGRLTVPGWGVREQWGAQVLLGGSDTQEHAFKAATTDAMKKCASMFGITLDLYGLEGMQELTVTPQDFLRDDNVEFDNLKKRIAEAQKERQGKPTAEPDTVDEELSVQDTAPATEQPVETETVNTNTAPAETNQHAESQAQEPEAQGPQVNEEVAAPQAQDVSRPWNEQDIKGMIKVKEFLGIQNNEELDKYVKEFMRNEEANLRQHITPSNIHDFLTYMNINYVNK